ncbi:envelope-like protein [Cucumis melo var. makuwa]|uniref:Envelope-like protein n=1 Tax=Cucumis melo var. makuwa TaxID=1194695 RepID=A0A5A7UQV0_CUCMM|nr:envelope-like protein [Cucumis melo var. makuwa]
MVNTCTGTYAGKSSEEANEALSLKAAMHGVRIRGQWFKSTLPRRPYRLPLKKSQADISKSCHKPMQKEVGSRDDVSLAPLIKKASVPDVVTEKSTDHVLSVHSQGSSSSEGVFIPTPDLHHTSFIEPGPSPHSHRLAEGRTDVCNDEPPAGDDDVAELSILMTIMVSAITLDFSPSSPSIDVLASVLSGGTLSSWPVNGIPTVALSVKYAILHKIGIANWFPSSHTSSVSAALETFLYRICNDDRVDIASDALGPDLKTLSLGYRLFQGIEGIMVLSDISFWFKEGAVTSRMVTRAVHSSPDVGIIGRTGLTKFPIAGCKIMETIREGPSASRPLVLDGKNYSYWKPHMIFFIKTLDGRAWRALMAGYDPPMSTVDGVSVPKLEIE